MIMAIIGNCMNLLSGCLLAFGSYNRTQSGGYYVWGASAIPWNCMLSLIAFNTAGHTKKVVTSALSLIAYCIGNLVGPQTFLVS
jgi:ACS family allantoate permease-like MFS transporter